MSKNIIATLILTFISSACSNGQVEDEIQVKSQINDVQENLQNKALNASSIEANKTFDEIFNQGIMRYPEWQTYLGIKQDYDKWNNISEEFSLETFELNKQILARLQAMNTRGFDDQTQISHRLYVQKISNSIDDYQWRYYNYPVNQMFGTHSSIPAFLINQHTINNEQEALDYIARVNNVETYIKQLIEGLKKRENLGLIPPRFVFPHVLRDAKNIITGAPFNDESDSTLLADFSEKVAKVELSADKKMTLIAQLNTALMTKLQPSYHELIAYLMYLETKADDRAGVWKFVNGDDFYKNALKRTTTTDLTAEQIHQIGLNEVKRIHDEMRQIKAKVGFNGDLTEFMHFMRTDEQFYYPNTPEGKAEYLQKAVAVIDDMEGRLDALFLTKPKAKLKVKAVEAFREQSAGKAFYQQPSPDGSRPGIYYANLYNMKSMPKYQLEALAYHEGTPGHHMQIAIKQELTGIPKFRKFSHYTAYTEGWGLYAEYLPKTIGLYQDPYSDFGRLSMELWRACRLVVDTGIHSQKWTREQGIEYYVTNTPDAKADAVKMVERHIVMPAQATAYKVGMLKIIDLKNKSKNALGEQFDIREYHDVVLKSGAVPLNVLEELVDNYITEKQQVNNL